MNPISTFVKLVCFLCCFLPVCLRAQGDSMRYDYAQFRFPDINRKALDITGSLLGSAGGVQANDQFSTTGQHFNQNLQAIYTQFINRDKLQAFRSVGLSSTYNAQRSRFDDSTTTRSHAFTPGMATAAFNRHYYKPNRYIEIGWNARVDYTDLKNAPIQNIPFLPPVTEQRYTYSVSLPLRYGIGRIEPIDDIFIAKFMVDDMRANTVLGAPLAQEDIFELGRIMAHARNQRIFDFRRQRIYELTQIHQWFQSKGIGQTGDLIFFTTLTDNWLYSFFNTRFAGKRFSVGITPYQEYQGRSAQLPFLQNGAVFSATYEKQSPVNQFWQLDYSLSFISGYHWANRRAELTPASSYINLGISGNFSAGFYPNSRTRMTGFALVSPDYRFNTSALTAPGLGDGLNLFSTIGTRIDYFLNFRTRLLGDVNVQHTFRDAQGANFSNYSLFGRVQLIYSLF